MGSPERSGEPFPLPEKGANTEVCGSIVMRDLEAP